MKTKINLEKGVDSVSQFVMVMIALLFVSTLAVVCIKSCSEEPPPPVFMPAATTPDTLMTTADSVFTYIFLARLEHPKIVMAQCVEESGNFKSLSFIHGHNCTGMRVPSQRPTLAVGVLYGHARFNSWQECIMDYAIWQSIYARGLAEDAYYDYLDRVYAEKKGYSGRLKKIIETRGL